MLLLASGETQVTRWEKLARPPFRSPGATSGHQHLCLPRSDTQTLFGIETIITRTYCLRFLFSQELNELRKWKSLERGACEPSRSVPCGFCSSSGVTIGRRLVGTKALTLSSPQIGTGSLIRAPHQKPVLMGHEFRLPGKEGSCS